MIKFDPTINQKIHSRSIDVSIYRGESETLVVEGVLKDERLLDSYKISGDYRPAGTIHHMIIRMQVKEPSLVIEDIEVEMPTTPNQICTETVECLALIKGMAIASGFTSKVKKLVGGVDGCVHLVTLLTAMAPAAFQGAFSAMESIPDNPRINVPEIVERMKNTCRNWRENGSTVKRLKSLYDLDQEF